MEWNILKGPGIAFALPFFRQEAIALCEILPLLRGDEGDSDAEERGSHSGGGQGYPHAFR